MAAPVRSLLVFCEGPHDVALVRRIFRAVFGTRRALGESQTGLKFREYPAPLNQLFPTALMNHAAMELSLDSAHRFFLPDHTLRRDDWWIFLFNGGGKNQTERVRRFLTDFLPLLEQAAVFPEDAEMYIRSPRYLFLYDADHNSPDSVWDWARTQFSSIPETSWEWGEWTGSTTTSARAGDKGVHVWAGSEGRGTLEDILQEMIEHSGQADLLESASAWMDENFDWDVDAEAISKRFAERAKRRKAIVTACGQREKPGFSMNVIVGQTRLIPDTELRNNQRIAAFVDFVSELTGLSPLENPDSR